MLTNRIGPFDNEKQAIEWAQEYVKGCGVAHVVIVDSYNRVFVQEREAARVFSWHQITHVIEPVIPATAVVLSAYVWDIDGLTRFDYSETDTLYRMCNLEGEPCARYARVEGEGC